MNSCTFLGHQYGPRIRLADPCCARCGKPKECKHKWRLALSSGYGENEYIEHRCSVCKAYRGKVGGVELFGDELHERHEYEWEGAKAIMWLLDNVEPTASAGGDPDEPAKPYKLEDGEIVPND